MFRGISTFSASCITLMGILPIISLIIYPPSAFILIVAYGPVFFFWTFFMCKFSRRHYNMDALIQKFMIGFFPGVIVSLICELFLSFVFAFIFLGDQLPSILNQMSSYREKHTEIDAEQMIASINVKKTFGLILFLFCLSFFVAGFVEESVKLFAGRCFDRLNNPRWNKNPIFIQSSILFAALGFATAENIGYAFQSKEFSNQLFTVFLRSIIATPIHLICAGLTGVELVKAVILKHGTVRKAIFPAITFHGIFNFQAFMMAILVAPKLSMAGFGFFSFATSVGFVLFGCFLVHRRIKLLNLRALLDQWDEQSTQSTNGLEQSQPLMEERDLNEIV